jgi:hypothetical protein
MRISADADQHFWVIPIFATVRLRSAKRRAVLLQSIKVALKAGRKL